MNIAYPRPKPGLITPERLYPLGTYYRVDAVPYRYACAGEDLKAMQLVKPGLSGKVELTPGLPDGMQCNELCYGDVIGAKRVDKNDLTILGWPTVDVKKGWHFWLREVPLGAKFARERPSV